MLEYLQKLETQNTTVIRFPEISWNQVLKLAKQKIELYLTKNPEVLYYVFTDPDIALVRTAPDILLFYAGILEACPHVNVVGPHLQISDLPQSYNRTIQVKERRQSKELSVVQRHSQFWTQVPNMATWNGLGYHLGFHPIDTTFAMRRRSLAFQRLTPRSIRTNAPYAAVHLDWYQDTNNLPADKIWYTSRVEKDVNHW